MDIYKKTQANVRPHN